MATALRDWVINPDEEDLNDGLTAQEKQDLDLALTNPIGMTARQRMESAEGDTVLVELAGTRRQRQYSHLIFTKAGACYFWQGKARVTPAQKAALGELKAIRTTK